MWEQVWIKNVNQLKQQTAESWLSELEKLDGQRADREGIVLNVCLMYIIDTLGPDHFEQTTNSSLDPIQLTGLEHKQAEMEIFQISSEEF